MMTVTELLLFENGCFSRFKEHVYSTKHHERQDYLFVVTFLESMYQNIVGDIPDEGEECVILLVVHKILDLRVIKLQFAPLQYESVP